MKEYLMLAGVVFAIAVALVATGSFVAFFRLPRMVPDASEKQRKVWQIGELVSGVIAVIAMWAVYLGMGYLSAEAPQVLKDFWVWYVTGFISRLPLLYFRDQIFHPHFATEWDELFGTFLNALLGPIQIIFTVWGIWKHWKNPWPWEKDE